MTAEDLIISKLLEISQRQTPGGPLMARLPNSSKAVPMDTFTPAQDRAFAAKVYAKDKPPQRQTPGGPLMARLPNSSKAIPMDTFTPAQDRAFAAKVKS